MPKINKADEAPIQTVENTNRPPSAEPVESTGTLYKAGVEVINGDQLIDEDADSHIAKPQDTISEQTEVTTPSGFKITVINYVRA